MPVKKKSKKKAQTIRALPELRPEEIRRFQEAFYNYSVAEYDLAVASNGEAGPFALMAAVCSSVFKIMLLSLPEKNMRHTVLNLPGELDLRAQELRRKMGLTQNPNQQQ